MVGYQPSDREYIFSLLLHLLDAHDPVGSRLCDRPFTSDIGPSFWYEDSHQVCEFIILRVITFWEEETMTKYLYFGFPPQLELIIFINQ